MTSRQQSWLGWTSSLLLACLTFGLWPELDLQAALQFYEPGRGFPANRWPLVQWVYIWAPILGTALTVLALMGILLRRACPSFVPRPYWRKMLAWVLIVFIGVGLVVHEGLKNQVGRPRPHQIQPMGGTASFVPALQVSHYCQRNCSFVSGHAAIGFALITFGMWSPRSTRRRWWIAGLLTGTAIGWVRVLQGGHFLSDVVFSFLAIWGTSLLIRGGWLYWRYQGLRRHQA